MLKRISNIYRELFKKVEYSAQEKLFIDLNKKSWLKNDENKIEILMEGFLDNPASVIERSLIAKALEKKEDIGTLILLRGISKKNSNVLKIFESFGFKNFIPWWKEYLNPKLFLLCLYLTVKVYIKYNDGEKLIELKYKELEIGDLIYDTLIRYDEKRGTIKSLKTIDFRHIFRAFYNFNKLDKIYKKHNIKYVISSHKVYVEYGILCRLGKKYGAKIYIADNGFFKIYDESISIKEHTLKISKKELNKLKSNKEYIEASEKYLSNRFNGEIDQVDVNNAFKNKKNYTRKELFEVLKIDKKNYDKKNIFILPHAFSDAPHCGESMLYKDYYDWLAKILNILEYNKNINIFIKPHPSSYMWNENGMVEELLIKENIKNIKIVPKNFNTNSIVKIADAILTVQGTAGLEFSCFGIPVLTASNGYYGGFGIDIESKTIEEYECKLKSIETIERLTEEQQLIAKLVLYLTFESKLKHEIICENIMPGTKNYEKIKREKYNEVNKKLKEGKCLKNENLYLSILGEKWKKN